MSYKKILCIDFDGVIHSYTSGWKGYDIVADPPVPGAIDWLCKLVESIEFEPVIYSSRSKRSQGIVSMSNWLLRYGMPEHILEKITFPTRKPAAFLTIDDRAICFNGVFPTSYEMNNFKSWNKMEI